MKVIHVPYTYFPDPVGGTEVYVSGLVRELRELGVDATVCAPGAADVAAICDGVPVRRFAGQTAPLTTQYSYGEGDHAAAEAFDRVLAEEAPSLVHLHAYSPVVSLCLARRIKALRIPLVFTYHTPAATCQRGSMLRWGTTPCDGRFSGTKCAACVMHARGLPRALARVAGYTPPIVGRLAGATGLSGRAWTALRLTDLVARKLASTAEFLRLPDAFVAPSEWVKLVLLRNGVPAERITTCAQGLSRAPILRRVCARAVGSALHVMALARMEPVKGLDVLVRSVRRHPELNVRLDLYALPQPEAPASYVARLRESAAADPRIRLLPPIDHADVVSTMCRYDVLAVPSQGFETGPLVVLEAFSAGIPVIGSRLPGIADRVANGRNGLLVPPADDEAWASAMRQLLDDPALLERMRRNVTTPDTMAAVALRMQSLYVDVTRCRSTRDIEPALPRGLPAASLARA